MRKLFVLPVVAWLLLAFTPAPAELKWLSWNEGYELAKKKNKIMVVDVYTDWCGWCKVMDRETFANAEIIDAINKEFVPVKFNPELPGANYTYDGKKYTGEQLAAIISNNQLSGYPTTVFYFPKKNEFVMEVGYKKPDAFKQILTKMLEHKKGK
jgi:uncharacterized protein YyaL (SSP411 family)